MNPKLIEIDGKMVNGLKLARMAGLPWSTVYQRLQRGWDVVDAFSEPVAGKASAISVHERIARHRAMAERHIAAANRLQSDEDDRVAMAQQAYILGDL